MDNYKIINKKNGRTYLLNEDQMLLFLRKNKVQNYNIINLTKEKTIKRNNILTNIAVFCFFIATILTTILIIELYY
tara:strand:+ start:470 stop:697 length:228 start_codon:yes stop_codon:yes gene_type:complete